MERCSISRSKRPHTGWACFLVLSFVFVGCSGNDWIAKVYVFKAEGALNHAAQLKERKVSFEERKKNYENACEYYRKAYDLNPSVFTFNRIEEAAQSCWKAGDREQEEFFRIFEEEYVKNHPQEYEYGDAGVVMDMGG